MGFGCTMKAPGDKLERFVGIISSSIWPLSYYLRYVRYVWEPQNTHSLLSYCTLCSCFYVWHRDPYSIPPSLLKSVIWPLYAVYLFFTRGCMSKSAWLVTVPYLCLAFVPIPGWVLFCFHHYRERELLRTDNDV